MNEFRLDGKTALITGGSSGIGKAIATAFARAGSDVAIAARGLGRLESAAEEIRGLGRRVVSIRADVTDRREVDDMVAEATRELGRVDILVNNAGGGGGAPIASLPDAPDRSAVGYRDPDDYGDPMSDETWHRVLNLNLSSAFYCCRAVGPQMLQRRSGKIINIASTSALAASPYNIAYNVAKAGVVMLTRVVANEWARYKVNANAISPGWFATELTSSYLGSDPPEGPEWTRRLVDWLPLRELAEVGDLGLLAVYLASPASDWMTGQNIALDGGESNFGH